jgi:hypothetical protein
VAQFINAILLKLKDFSLSILIHHTFWKSYKQNHSQQQKKSQLACQISLAKNYNELRMHEKDGKNGFTT